MIVIPETVLQVKRSEGLSRIIHSLYGIIHFVALQILKEAVTCQHQDVRRKLFLTFYYLHFNIGFIYVFNFCQILPLGPSQTSR